MTITYVGSGSRFSHSDTVTMDYPASVAAGQLAILQVVSGHPNDSQPSTPSGWTLVGSMSGGGGTFALNAGPRRLTFFARELTGGDAQPTTSIPSGSTGSVIAGQMIALSRSAGTGWRWAATFGEDTVSDTAFSAACSTAITWAVGDWVALGYVWADQNATSTVRAITATGITYAAVTSHLNGAVADGYGARLTMVETSVTAGTGTQAPTVTATLSSASVGVAAAVRVREATSDVTAAAQSVDPPRNLVSATGLLADDIITATLYRQVGTTLTAVRAASDVDVTGTDALLRVDAEQPFGVSLNYAAVFTDVNGNTWTTYSGPITSTVTSDVISDAIRGVGAHIHIEDWADKKRTRDATTFNCGGRLVVVGKQRSAAQGTVTVSTDTADDGNALQGVLDNATEGVILIRAQTSAEGVDNYLALISDNERRNWQIAYREWDLETAETEAWPDVLEAAGYTLQDIANNLSTLQDIASFFPGTLLDIALYDWGG